MVDPGAVPHPDVPQDQDLCPKEPDPLPSSLVQPPPGLAATRNSPRQGHRNGAACAGTHRWGTWGWALCMSLHLNLDMGRGVSVGQQVGGAEEVVSRAPLAPEVWEVAVCEPAGSVPSRKTSLAPGMAREHL